MSMRSMRPLAALTGRMAARPVMGAARVGALRMYSTQDPKSKAQSIIDALPGNSVLSKSGILATGFGAGVYAIANSLYVVNAETVLLAVFAAFITVASKTLAPAYKEWAEGHIQHIKTTLDKAREAHVVAVQDRIDNVEQLGSVVQVTKDLFAVSKQTVKLEAEAFELKQKAELAYEARSVLDSWVRYENSVRTREQEDLLRSVIAKVEKVVHTEKFQKDTLAQAITEVEQLFKKSS